MSIGTGSPTKRRARISDSDLNTYEGTIAKANSIMRHTQIVANTVDADTLAILMPVLYRILEDAAAIKSIMGSAMDTQKQLAIGGRDG